MLNNVFISYRRDDSAGHAGRVHDRLAHEFGANLFFMDVDGIPLGSDFIKVLRGEVEKCDVLLAVIGNHWLDARDAQGRRRLDDENDVVRIEIAAALQRDIPVIPILLDNAKIPRADELPADLRGLAGRNALDIRHGSFHADMDRLVNALKSQGGGVQARSELKTKSESTAGSKWPRVLLTAIALVVVAAAVGWLALQRLHLTPPARQQESALPSAGVQPVPVIPPSAAVPAPSPPPAPPTPAPSPPPAAAAPQPQPQSQPQPQPPAQAQPQQPQPQQATAPAPGKLAPYKVQPLNASLERALKPNDSFKECDTCPVMTVVAAGSFDMGSPTTEIGRVASESPQHQVTIAHKFAIGRYAVTFDEWDACVADGGCRGYAPADQGWGRGKRPVVNVSWNDVHGYLTWLSHKTGKPYRLPTEAEREYVARAGTTTPFWWGSTITSDQANYNGTYIYGDNGVRGEFRGQTVPVDTFVPNPWGIFQMNGNVSEWTEDCWHDNYYGGPPLDGTAWASPDCKQRVRRGGSIGSPPHVLRAAARLFGPQERGQPFIGFRVVRTLSE